MNAERLASMKPNAIIINTSRGAIIDEEALAQALQTERIAGAGLDAFETEPVRDHSPLLSLDNVLLSPHCAGTTADTWRRRGAFAFGNIARVWKGLPADALVGEIKHRPLSLHA